MPLKFRVWDKKHQEMYGELSLADVSTPVKISGQDYAVISQDTGLKDKNGKSIWTGDIVKEVHYDGITTYHPIAYYKGRVLFHDRALWDFYPENVEVVGNIWQNLELLEKN